MPDDIASIPDEALGFVSGQVDAAPHELLAYGTRAQTRSDHLQLVLPHLEWRRVEDRDRERLAAWLVQRAVEHDSQQRCSFSSPSICAPAGCCVRLSTRSRG